MFLKDDNKWWSLPCMTPCMLRKLGTVFAVVGGILVVVFVPIRYWMALVGLILLLAGLAIRVSI